MHWPAMRSDTDSNNDGSHTLAMSATQRRETKVNIRMSATWLLIDPTLLQITPNIYHQFIIIVNIIHRLYR